MAGEKEHTLMSMYHEVIEALSLLVQTLDKLGIVYYIGGSVSSAIHGPLAEHRMLTSLLLCSSIRFTLLCRLSKATII